MSDYADGGILRRIKRFFGFGNSRQEPEDDGMEIEMEDFSGNPEQTGNEQGQAAEEQQNVQGEVPAGAEQNQVPAETEAIDHQGEAHIDGEHSEADYYGLDQTTDRGKLVRKLVDIKPKIVSAAAAVKDIKPPQEKKEEGKEGEKKEKPKEEAPKEGEAKEDEKAEEKKPHPKMDGALKAIAGLEKIVNGAIKTLVDGKPDMRYAMLVKGCGLEISKYLLALQEVTDLTEDELKLVSSLNDVSADISTIGLALERDFLKERVDNIAGYFSPIFNKLDEIKGDNDSKSEIFSKVLGSVEDLKQAFLVDRDIDMNLATAMGWVNAYLEKVSGNRHTKNGKKRQKWAEEMKYLLTLASGISWDVGQGREIPQVNLEEDAPEHEDKEKKESDKGDVKPEKKPDSGDTLMKESDIETIYWDLAGLVQDSHTVEAAQEMFDKYGDNEADSAYYRTLYDICEKLVNSERYHIDAPELVERFKQYEKQFIIGKAKPRHKKMKRKGKKYKKAK